MQFAVDLPSEKILLISTDPAHSIRDSLADRNAPSNLEVIELSAESFLNKFKAEHGAKLLEIANRGTFLDKQDILRFIDLSVPGMDELFGFLEISKLAGEGRFGRIVVDTAPTGHTLRLLVMPGAMEGWLEALDALLAKHRYMMEVFRGIYRPDDLDQFLEDMDTSRQGLEEMLRDHSLCRFIPVITAEDMSVLESARLLEQLDALGIRADEILVNRIYPENQCHLCYTVRKEQLAVISRLPKNLANRSLWSIPLYPDEVRGERLTAFWGGLSRVRQDNPAFTKSSALLASRADPVVNPAPLPSPATRLILFAGKGGVGKTTLACATAVRLVDAYPDKRVLLFSADPAHSLSDALDIQLGPSPSRISKRLFAMEINAEAEFATLKDEYSSDIDEFFGTYLGNLDLTFDREVMERILDLSPPGLDEIMALTRMTDFLVSGSYDLIVLDAAPTGHLIRLMELPEVLDQWIKAFFELFLKYRDIFRPPQMSERLVSLSKSLKLLRTILRSSTEAFLHAVTIPTEMAREETADLLSACARLGIAVPLIFINMVTPPGDCPFCSRMRERESEVMRKVSRQFSEHDKTIVYRQSDIRGINLLLGLGNSLYTSVPAH